TRNGALRSEGKGSSRHDSWKCSGIKTKDDARGTELMDKKIRTFTERETASKRKFENTLRNTQNQQQHSNKRSVANTNNANNQRGTRSGQKSGCYECGVQGHFKRECPNLKNNNHQGNQSGRNNAPARVYAVGRAGTDPDANVVTEKYVKKGFPIFLAHIKTKEVEDKSEEKRLEDVPIVRDFPEYIIDEDDYKLIQVRLAHPVHEVHEYGRPLIDDNPISGQSWNRH
nr:hypothetical protein [Tanacetum cinerariifolium]